MKVGDQVMSWCMALICHCPVWCMALICHLPVWRMCTALICRLPVWCMCMAFSATYLYDACVWPWSATYLYDACAWPWSATVLYDAWALICHLPVWCMVLICSNVEWICSFLHCMEPLSSIWQRTIPVWTHRCLRPALSAAEATPDSIAAMLFTKCYSDRSATTVKLNVLSR